MRDPCVRRHEKTDDQGRPGTLVPSGVANACPQACSTATCHTELGKIPLGNKISGENAYRYRHPVLHERRVSFLIGPGDCDKQCPLVVPCAKFPVASPWGWHHPGGGITLGVASPWVHRPSSRQKSFVIVLIFQTGLVSVALASATRAAPSHPPNGCYGMLRNRHCGMHATNFLNHGT